MYSVLCIVCVLSFVRVQCFVHCMCIEPLYVYSVLCIVCVLSFVRVQCFVHCMCIELCTCTVFCKSVLRFYIYCVLDMFVLF